ncbi:hypothetical protein BXY51_006173 [Actinoplanes cyaneus]|nr:hypothetical protein [Actinoplanes cyaneus]
MVTAQPVREGRFSTELSSRDRGLPFSASFVLRWQGQEQTFLAAKRDLHQWAVDRSSRLRVTDSEYLDAVLNLQLCQQWVRRIDADTRIISAEAAVQVDPDVLNTYAEMQAIRRRAAVERLRWETDLEELRFLREHVFSRPEVARSYWLKNHLDRPGDFNPAPFDKIAASFAASPEASVSARIAGLVGDFISGLNEEQRGYLIGQIGQVFSSYSRNDLSELVSDADSPDAVR